MNFEELSNPWSEFRLPDGRLMRIRHVLVDVTCTGIGEDGNPSYNLNYAPPIVWIEPTVAEKAVQKLADSPNAQKGSLQ